MVSYLPHLVFLTISIGAIAMMLSNQQPLTTPKQPVTPPPPPPTILCPLPITSITNYNIADLQTLPEANAVVISKLQEMKSIVDEIKKLEDILKNTSSIVTKLNNDQTLRDITSKEALLRIADTLNEQSKSIATSGDNETANSMVIAIKKSQEYKKAERIYKVYADKFNDIFIFQDNNSAFVQLQQLYRLETENINELLKSAVPVNSPFAECSRKMLTVLNDVIKTNFSKITNHISVVNNANSSLLFTSFFESYTLTPELELVTSAYVSLQETINNKENTITSTWKYLMFGLCFLVLLSLTLVVTKYHFNVRNDDNHNVPKVTIWFIGKLTLLYVLMCVISIIIDVYLLRILNPLHWVIYIVVIIVISIILVALSCFYLIIRQ